VPWAFQGIETMRRAIFVMQRSLDTASHNIANAATPGYSRQQVHSAPTDPYTLPSATYEMGSMEIGTGIKVQAILRIRNEYLDTQVHAAKREYGRLDMLRTTLGQAETVFNEPQDGALSQVFSDFWNGWQDVSRNPESTASRAVLVGRASELTRRAHDAFGSLVSISSDIRSAIADRSDEIDALTPQLAQLNTEITQIRNMGFEPNDLLDERDRLLDRLSELTDYRRSDMDDGTVAIHIGSQLVVSGRYSYKLSGTSAITSGEIGGLNESLGTVSGLIDDLNAMVSEVISQVNALHTTGYDLGGNAGGVFFLGTDADTIEINPDITNDVSKVAAGLTPAAGDGGNAGRIADLRAALTMQGGTLSFDDYYNTFISSLGVKVQSSDAGADARQLIVEQTENQRQSVSGVSLDEELTDMLQFQRSYEAAARCLTVLDEMMQTLIQQLGVGGR
jgi:flagellar hook-associated protein 1 FlgK